MSNFQSFLLTVNPKNGTVVIPKKVRRLLKISSTNRSELLLKVYNNHAEITIPEYSIDDVLFNLPPLKPKRSISKKQIEDAREEAAIERFKNSTL